ncbi:nuclease-related domain-containing protein [Bacillus sp. 2205SS5-2]|uniref:nuclease-related domain-containing protein n=1 Tax=Bacillus sp. 2205SS5-2 TaxID=3109031 RepID=UPI0030065321
MKKGYQGEESLAFPLRFLPEEALILHDVRLKHQASYFQLDTVLLTSRYLTIVEAKNINVTITFHGEFGQMIRSQNGVEEGLPNPTLQVRRQKIQLIEWIKSHHLPLLPVESLVAFARPSTILKFTVHAPPYKK